MLLVGCVPDESTVWQNLNDSAGCKTAVAAIQAAQRKHAPHAAPSEPASLSGPTQSVAQRPKSPDSPNLQPDYAPDPHPPHALPIHPHAGASGDKSGDWCEWLVISWVIGATGW